MRSYKGSKKDFYRYVKSEIDDDYLEPLESEIFSTNDSAPISSSEPRKCHCEYSGDCRHQHLYQFTIPNKSIVYSRFSLHYPSYHSYDPVKKPGTINATVTRPKTRKLTDETMMTCISNLGTDAKNCYYGLQEFKILRDRAILEQFKEIYSALETIHVLYLSVACSQENGKIEAVYLWQMNEKCPCLKEDGKQPSFSVLTDVKSNLTNLRYFPSILLLAKITPEAGEEILEAKILGDNKLFIQSKITSELVYKIFNVTSFETSARVNPLHQNILANSLYTWKLKVSSSLSEVQVSAWKKCTLEELDQDIPTDENKVDERTYNSITPDTALTFVEHSFSGWTVLIDKRSSTFIIWKENTIDIFSLAEMTGTIQTFEVIKQTFCVLINTKGQVFTFNIHELPSINVQATPHIIPFFEEKSPKIQLLDAWDKKNNVKAVGLVYFWEGKFYYVNLMGNEPAIVLHDLKDETLPQDFKCWRFTEGKIQRLLFYVKNDVLNIYDIKKSRHQTQKLLFDYTKEKSRDWKICTESPTALYVHTVEGPEMLVREINYKGEPYHFFNDQSEIKIQYFDEESPINHKNKNIVQIETPYRGTSIVLLRMKEPFYEDGLHYMSYDGPLYYIPPNLKKELEEVPEKRERCPYHKLVDRMEIIKKRAERYQYDEKFAEEAEKMQKDIQNLIAKRVNERKEKLDKYDEYCAKPWNRWERNTERIYEPEEIDFKKYLDLYKEIKQVQKSIKAAKVRQSVRPKNDVI